MFWFVIDKLLQFIILFTLQWWNPFGKKKNIRKKIRENDFIYTTVPSVIPDFPTGNDVLSWLSMSGEPSHHCVFVSVHPVIWSCVTVRLLYGQCVYWCRLRPTCFTLVFNFISKQSDERRISGCCFFFSVLLELPWQHSPTKLNCLIF